MNGRIAVRVLLAVTLIVVMAGLGFYAYNLGLGQGLVESGKIIAPDGAMPSAGAAPYAYGPWGGRPFFGFGIFSCFVPLLFLFLFFGLMRAIFGHRPRGWGRHYGPWSKDIPPMVEEWHRKMHEPESKEKV
jgi:hypothetical protein